MPTPKEICVASCSVSGNVNCFDDPRNTEGSRVAKGLNPEYSGCPACHQRSEQNVTIEDVVADMEIFMTKIRSI